MGQRIAVLGTGKMGEALVSGMLRAGKPVDEVVVTARRADRAAELTERYGVAAVSNADAAKNSDTLILTVKPQDMGALLAELAPHVPADRLVISGAAGITTVVRGVQARHRGPARGPRHDEHAGAGGRGDVGDLARRARHRGAPAAHRGDLPARSARRSGCRRRSRTR